MELHFFLFKRSDLSLKFVWEFVSYSLYFTIGARFDVHYSDFKLSYLARQINNLLLQAMLL